MRSISMVGVFVAMAMVGFADFRYISTVKSGVGVGSVTKHMVKGNKMRVETSSAVMISDFDANTVTTLNPSTKTYRVSAMGQAGAALEKSGTDIKTEVRETDQKKMIGGFNCKQIVMTIAMTGQTPMNIESEMWVSADVPGAAELKAISAKMAERSFGSGANPQMQKAMADMQKQSAKIGGVPVLSMMRVKAGDDAKSKAMQAQMQAARAQMEAMKKKGGPGAEQIDKALASMPTTGAKYLMEMTTESSGFSTAAIPASDFDVPAGFKKAER